MYFFSKLPSLSNIKDCSSTIGLYLVSGIAGYLWFNDVLDEEIMASVSIASGLWATYQLLMLASVALDNSMHAEESGAANMHT